MRSRNRKSRGSVVFTDSTKTKLVFSSTQTRATNKEIYANFMDEIKMRLEFITISTNGILKLNPILTQELCYLQLRMICECIALSCLVAHGDITDINLESFIGDYEADKIIRKLESLHDAFYPYPVKMTVTPPCDKYPTGNVDLEDKPAGFLTKIEFLSLYGRCGEHLHRGRLRTIENRPPYKQPDFSDIVKGSNKITLLLDQHRIGSKDNKKHLLIALNPFGQSPTVFLAQSP